MPLDLRTVQVQDGWQINFRTLSIKYHRCRDSEGCDRQLIRFVIGRVRGSYMKMCEYCFEWKFAKGIISIEAILIFLG